MRPPSNSPSRLVVRLNWLLCLALIIIVLALTGCSSPRSGRVSLLDEACTPRNAAEATAKNHAIDALVFDNCPPTDMSYYGVDGRDVDNCGYSSQLPCRCLTAAFRAMEACVDSGKAADEMKIMRLEPGGRVGQIVVFPVSKPLPDPIPIIPLLLVLAAVIVGLAFGYGVPSLLRRRSTHR